jgi:hypothetical protein
MGIDPTALTLISKGEVHRLSFWLNSLGEDWRGDVPLRLHESDRRGKGVAPPFSPEFVAYVGYLECSQPDCSSCREQRKVRINERLRNPEPRLRATRAFRKLRKIAPREFDALYLYCINRFTINQIAIKLNERSIRLGKPERYNEASVLLLLLSGIDKVAKFW